MDDKPDLGDQVNDELVDRASEAWDVISQACENLGGFGWYPIAKSHNPNIAYSLMQICRQVDTAKQLEKRKLANKTA